ncbi:MAG: acyl-CoA/acyl-ACP dehydrogenase [Deltaproteobacteria bacterium]|jgi:alkylation response protein AidB-like acyl-CoA dehydrogenase|nr:acyl-CoA/acyl-ACP dehydrogenase [Deltaproteobacteria bacterium]
MSYVETEEQQMLRQQVREIGRKYGRDYYTDKARAGESPDELWAEVAKQGFIGVNTPEEYGGGGLGIYELAIVCEELAAAGCPLLLLLVSPAICATVIARFGTAAQKERWLPGLASGELKMAFAITEPNAGSNSHKLETAAVRDGDDWVLSGTKYYISGADDADAILVVARTGGAEDGRGRLSLFIVDANASGLEKTLIKMQIPGADRQFTLFFDNVRLRDDRILGNEGQGLPQVFVGLNPERILGAALANGAALHALEQACRYANERAVWGKPIGTHQGIAHPLAEAKIEVELARLMTMKAAWLFDQGRDAGEAANMAKFAAGEAATRAVDTAIQVHGGNGMSEEYGLVSLWGLARTLRIAPVSREMILNFISQHVLGLPKSY